MMRGTKFWLAAGATLALAAVSVPASADVTIGAWDSANCYPFTCAYTGTYQQVYGSSAFSGPITINTVQFYIDPNFGSPSLNSNSYTLSFYLTNKAVDGLSTNGTDNETTLLSNFGTFTPGLSYSFTGNGFTYDPTLGNLLLNVSTTNASNVGAFMQAANTQDSVSRLFQNTGAGPYLTDTRGLVTTFSLVGGGVPEPSTWAMMLLGFAGIGGALRRRGVAQVQAA